MNSDLPVKASQIHTATTLQEQKEKLELISKESIAKRDRNIRNLRLRIIEDHLDQFLIKERKKHQNNEVDCELFIKTKYTEEFPELNESCKTKAQKKKWSRTRYVNSMKGFFTAGVVISDYDGVC